MAMAPIVQHGVVAAMLGRQFPIVETLLRDAEPRVAGPPRIPGQAWKKVWSTNPLERLIRCASTSTAPAHRGPSPPQLSEHPPDDPAPGVRARTQPTRPRPPTRLPQPTSGDQPRRRQDRDRTITRPATAHRLKIKLML
jgi:putative transposase